MDVRKISCIAVVAMLADLWLPRLVAAQDYQREIDRLAEEVAASAESAGLKNIAVMDFTDLQSNVQEIGRFMSEELTTSLVLKKRPFRTIDRANLRSILVEQKLTMTGLIDLDNVRKLKISGIDGLVAGTLTPLGDGIRITVKVIKIETAEYVGAARGVVPKTSTMDSLGTEIEGAGVSSSGPATQQSAGYKKGKYVVQDKTLRMTLKYLRKDSGSQARAIVLVESLREEELRICLESIEIVDDQGEHWERSDNSGMAMCSYETTITPDSPVTALVEFRSEKSANRATKFNLLGRIRISDGSRRWGSSLSFQDVPSGL